MSQKLIVRPVLGKNQKINITAVSASNGTLLTAPMFRIYATVDCYVRFTVGASVAVDTDTFIPSDTDYVINRDSVDTISVIRADGADGTLHVTELA